MSFSSVNTVVAAYSPAHLVVVAKNRDIAEIQRVIYAGATALAFNRVQEAAEKFPALKFNGSRHLIGHLQRNKAAAAVRLFDCIESIDSLRIATAVNRAAAQADTIQSVLLQVNTAADPAKYGFAATELPAAYAQIRALPALRVDGLMTIGKLNTDPTATFIKLRQLADELDLHEVSMGMSNDYHIALACGATIVRVGTACFKK